MHLDTTIKYSVLVSTKSMELHVYNCFSVLAGISIFQAKSTVSVDRIIVLISCIEHVEMHILYICEHLCTCTGLDNAKISRYIVIWPLF